jgi:phospholipase/carboxylesterase
MSPPVVGRHRRVARIAARAHPVVVPIPAHDEITRRSFLSTTLGIAAALVGCGGSPSGVRGDGPERVDAPIAAPTRAATTGLQPLGLGTGRDGLLYVPSTYQPSEPLPLLVLLHGAGGVAGNWFGSYDERGEAARIVMLAPDSRGATWDATGGRFGPDVRFLESALRWTFDRVAIASGKVGIVGFSDGASYALSLGIANGDYFDRIVAYSPGFIARSSVHGRPPIFISHGTSDGILPIASTSRVIVPELRRAGYQVAYTEFDGGHEVPQAISDAAIAWLRTSWG